MKMLRTKLLDAERTHQQNAISSERKSQVGSGDRSERIRTYNYPQSRLTDHRIGLTLYSLEQILDGDLDAVIDALKEGDKVQLVGFGTFEVRERGARTGLNPRTKEKIEIAASKVPAFKAGKAFKDAIAE